VPDRLRPIDRMVAHTGYLVFSRKVSREISQADYWMDRKRRKFEEVQAESIQADILKVPPGSAEE